MELELKRNNIEEKREKIAMEKKNIKHRLEIVEICREIEGVKAHLANLVNKLNNTKATLEGDLDKKT